MNRHVPFVRAAIAAGVLALTPSLALAQGTTPPAKPTSSPAPAPARDRGVELTIGAAWTGSISFGSADANLQAPDGSSLTLFKTSSELSSGTGFEAHLGFRVTRRLSVEASGTWTKAEVRTNLSADFEGAEPITATVGTSRFTLEGSVLWTVITRGRAQFFARGGAGWQRDLDENSVLIEDGAIVNLGGGMKYWWRDQPHGALHKLGARVEARAAIRTAGISLDQRSTRVAPVVAGGLVIGF
jgi:opacity protein-like surface antigen